MALFNGKFDTKVSSYNELRSPNLRNFVVCLCKTDPVAIFDEYAWNKDSIKLRQTQKGFDISIEAEDMEVDKDDNLASNKEIKDPKLATPAKSVN
jgi:hypothetical protein